VKLFSNIIATVLRNMQCPSYKIKKYPIYLYTDLSLSMATTTPTTVFTWHIAQLERETEDGYVYSAHYTVDANDGTYSAGAYGSIGFERPENLIPFSELSEEITISWVKEKLGGEEKVAEIESALQGQINQQRSPTKAQGLPWNN
jgi:hypothetical protein